jgi:hypothetical protein
LPYGFLFPIRLGGEKGSFTNQELDGKTTRPGALFMVHSLKDHINSKTFTDFFLPFLMTFPRLFP